MDERLKILKLLEEGKINAIEAERLLRALSKSERNEKRKITDIEEFLESVNSLNISVFGGNLEIKRGRKNYIEKYGLVELEKDGDVGNIKVNGALCEMFINKTLPLTVNVTLGNCEIETDKDFKLIAKYSNLEVIVASPVNIEIDNSFGNTEIIYLVEPDANFEIKNQFGGVDNDFKNPSGSKNVKINNSFGRVHIIKKTGG